MKVFALHGLIAGVAAILFATQLQVNPVHRPERPRTHRHHGVGGRRRLHPRRHRHVVGSTLAAILFAAIGSSLIFLNVSAYWLRAVQGILILATVLADMARRGRAN